MDYIMETVGLRKAYKDNIVVDDVNMHGTQARHTGRFLFPAYRGGKMR